MPGLLPAPRDKPRERGYEGEAAIMTRAPLLSVLLLGLTLAAADGADDGSRPLFNGRDLTGWARVNPAPGTFFVKDNEIITTGKPMGFLRTDRQYENFIAE